MASIISSTISFANPQTDGRIAVCETHIDDSGNSNTVNYLADANTDQIAHMAASAVMLAASLTDVQVDNELAVNLAAVISQGSIAVPSFNFSTLQQNAQALIAAYNASNGAATIMIGDFLNAQSDALLIAGSGLAQAEIDSFRPLWQQNAMTAATIRSAAPAGG